MAPTTEGRRDPGGLAPLMLPVQPGMSRRATGAGPAVKAGPAPEETGPVEPPFGESVGRMTKTVHGENAEAAQAIAACRNSGQQQVLVKSAGTSLMPAAMTVPNPFHQRLLPSVRLGKGPMISALRTRLTWHQVHGAEHGLVPEGARAAEKGDAKAGPVLWCPGRRGCHSEVSSARMSTATKRWEATTARTR